MGNATSKEWERPELQARGKILHWNTQTLADASHLVMSVSDDLEGRREGVAADARKLFRVPDKERAPWDWVCKLYIRVPNAGSPIIGNKMKTEWITATASFIAAAHEADQKGQWLITAAHNLLANVYEYSADGILTGYKMALAPADAVYIEVGFGDHKYGGWADKVSIMKGYYDNVAHIDLDGAAIHIKDSLIPSEFWMKAPPLSVLPASPNTLNVPFLVAGFPGGINEYPELQGFYLAGHHIPPEGPVQSIAKFREVAITPTEVKDLKGHFILTFKTVPSFEGISGGPLIMGSGQDQKIIAVLNTLGIGVLLVEKNAQVYGVDFENLLEAIGGTITKA